MSDTVEVLAHEHDRDEGVYRLVVGVPLWDEVEQQVQTGEEEHPDAASHRDNAAALRAQADQVRADDEEYAGELEAQAARLEKDASDLPPTPTFEMRSERVLAAVAAYEDFVFAADDERWEGMDAEQVAKAQREIVAKALAERWDEADESRDVQSLPGVGEKLA